jgi:NAD(P)-dependent dehydrogenase (short-subunit alcohol dehydrogenase family)
MPPMRLKDKTAIVTGAGRGIGSACAKLFAAEGAAVVIAEIDEATGAEAARSIEAAGGRALLVRTDVGDAADARALVARTVEAFGGVDVLVNNAGMSIRRSVEHSYERMRDIQRLVQLNYYGAVRLILGLLPGMRERRDGHVVNVSSIGVQTRQPRFSAYVASKAALDAFSRSVANEVVDDGVVFTTLYMPLVRTPMIAPTTHFRYYPTHAPSEAAALVVRAIATRPTRLSSTLGRVGELTHALVPSVGQTLMNAEYHLFPDSARARGEEHDEPVPDLVPEPRDFAYLLRAVRWGRR